MVVNAPERSLEQRQEALTKANTVRTERADLKKEMKAGRANVYQLIRDPPEVLQTMKLWDFLIAIPKFGRVKVNKMLTQCRISPSKTMGGLSQRQREEVARMLIMR